MESVTEIPTTKVCKKCQVEKPLDEFPRETRKPMGRKARCRPCAAEDQRRLRAAKKSVERARSHSLKSTIDHTMPNAEMSDLERRRREAAAEAIFWKS